MSGMATGYYPQGGDGYNEAGSGGSAAGTPAASLTTGPGTGTGSGTGTSAATLPLPSPAPPTLPGIPGGGIGQGMHPLGAPHGWVATGIPQHDNGGSVSGGIGVGSGGSRSLKSRLVGTRQDVVVPAASGGGGGNGSGGIGPAVGHTMGMGMGTNSPPGGGHPLIEMNLDERTAQDHHRSMTSGMPVSPQGGASQVGIGEVDEAESPNSREVKRRKR